MYKFNPQRIQIGISACLLGEKVRFDGGTKILPIVIKRLKIFLIMFPFVLRWRLV